MIDPSYGFSLSTIASLAAGNGSVVDATQARMYCENGDALGKQDRLKDAAISYRQALSYNPAYAEAYAGLGSVFMQRRLYKSAIESFRRAIALKPDFVEAHCNLGSTLVRCGEFDQALKHCRHAVSLDPSSGFAHYVLGSALFYSGAGEEAMEQYRVALRVDSDLAEARLALAFGYLRSGDFENGLPLYEWRFELAHLRVPTPKRQVWRGEPLRGDRILLYADQGLGDTLQFSRYVPLVAERGGSVVLQVPPALRRLLSDLYGPESVIVPGDSYADVSWHCSLSSLPLAFDTATESIPQNTPYLKADKSEIEKWDELLSGEERLKIGLVWAGDPRHSTDWHRSFPLREFEPLHQVQGAAFFSLQKGPAAKQLVELTEAFRVRDLGLSTQLNDMSDLAAIITLLDLVITVDTSVAHLVGAMGRPVWILLSHVADWRWLTEREDTPWYPSARLFRQPAPGDWKAVIARVLSELNSFAIQKNVFDCEPCSDGRSR